MQIWLFTIMILAVLRFAKDFKKRWLIVCGVAMSFEVLAYPACLILFPFLCIAVGRMGERHDRWKDILLVVIVCAICAVIWLFTVLSKITINEFVRNLKQILSFDATHSLNAMTESKMPLLNSGMLELFLMIILIFLFSAGICFLIKRKVDSLMLAVLYMSDMGIWNAIPTGILGALWGVIF